VFVVMLFSHQLIITSLFPWQRRNHQERENNATPITSTRRIEYCSVWPGSEFLNW